MLRALSRQQKEAVGLLQIGTFLEYFDLMLYVHMAVLLNELFFPKTDPHTAALLAAFAFCSTYVLRPFGALIFGYIGDNMGRKVTVIITTAMMAISCIVIANVPTYEQIGITAAWLVTACRITQGLASMGEIIAAEIYTTEVVKPPAQYFAVSCMGIAAMVGTVVAVAIAFLMTSYTSNWRAVFWIGAAIAMVGSMARVRLRETPDFLEAIAKKSNKPFVKQKKTTSSFNKKTFLAFFCVAIGWPLCFYLIFIYFNATLTSKYNYTSTDIIFHNFVLSVFTLLFYVFWSLLSKKYFPLNICKNRAFMALALFVLLPILLKMASSDKHILLIQMMIALFGISTTPMVAIIISSFPTLTRVKSGSFGYALSRAIMHVISSFGLVYLSEAFGYYGLWLVTIPVTIAHIWGIYHFEQVYQKNRLKESADSVLGKFASKVAA